MQHFFRTLATALQDLLLPPRCHICHKPVPDAGRLHICPDCRADLPLAGSPVCSICGIPFQSAGDDHPCSRCIAAPPPYTAARAALRYEGACRDLIHHFKYNGKSYLRRPLGLITAELLAPFVAAQQPDLLVPVPLHPSRLRSRGFNQAVLLGDLLSRQWQIPLLRQGLTRTRPTPPQMELSREQRSTNLRGAFAVTAPDSVNNRHVMLVDDVFTTGSTLAECALVLQRAGCRTVSAVTVAHAP
ncbi:ComF family protein [Trichlorobacter lovleyi]|uniref:ComF family protein n=1 Tax=Trichlorobacter lovleyi TaxID=313985 RepID=UPI002240849B|nr:ComF family protein [Trichlorobacter lovleyi]QOX79936.1 ComF family protein [Trichlorobacter lovleyi]